MCQICKKIDNSNLLNYLKIVECATMCGDGVLMHFFENYELSKLHELFDNSNYYIYHELKNNKIKKGDYIVILEKINYENCEYL